jgi:EamA domain-containing membrane protein RarD
VFLYHEPFNLSLLIGFSLVWLALVIFWGENLLASRKTRSLPSVS